MAVAEQEPRRYPGVVQGILLRSEEELTHAAELAMSYRGDVKWVKNGDDAGTTDDTDDHSNRRSTVLLQEKMTQFFTQKNNNTLLVRWGSGDDDTLVCCGRRESRRLPCSAQMPNRTWQNLLWSLEPFATTLKSQWYTGHEGYLV